jgi:hypothetical protein
MVAGADSIDDLGVIRHGALPELFGGIRAPSTLGTFLRGFTWALLTFPWVVIMRLLAWKGGRRSPRVSSAMAMRDSGLSP